MKPLGAIACIITYKEMKERKNIIQETGSPGKADKRAHLGRRRGPCINWGAGNGNFCLITMFYAWTIYCILCF